MFLSRLCRLPRRGVAGLTEDCFQRNPLDFVGDKTELRKLYKNGKGGKWWSVKAQRTTQNTRPKGSQWTKVAEPNAGRKSAFSNHAKIRKDQVLVPLKLRPGSYVLSFRWDCKKTPQVIWQSQHNKSRISDYEKETVTDGVLEQKWWKVWFWN